jgi:hypothetical protein
VPWTSRSPAPHSGLADLTVLVGLVTPRHRRGPRRRDHRPSSTRRARVRVAAGARRRAAVAEGPTCGARGSRSSDVRRERPCRSHSDAKWLLDEVLHPVPGRRRGVADGDRVEVVWDVGRRVQRPLERFFEELLNAAGVKARSGSCASHSCPDAAGAAATTTPLCYLRTDRAIRALAPATARAYSSRRAWNRSRGAHSARAAVAGPSLVRTGAAAQSTRSRAR